ncbi:MAG TPA: hypothetical protein VGM91_07145, partial [Conexibacter sp.]
MSDEERGDVEPSAPNEERGTTRRNLMIGGGAVVVAGVAAGVAIGVSGGGDDGGVSEAGAVVLRDDP